MEQTVPAGHAIPQPPQFAEWLVVSTQPPAQAVSPAEHVQLPFSQLVAAGQRVPQAPQFATSLMRSWQLAPHCAVPTGHMDGADPAGVGEEQPGTQQKARIAREEADKRRM